MKKEKAIDKAIALYRKRIAKSYFLGECQESYRLFGTSMVRALRLPLGPGIKQMRELELKHMNKAETVNPRIEKREKQGFIYCMINRRNGLTKIGWSKKPEFRELTLQSEEPEISLLFSFPGTLKTEKAIHQYFVENRKRGEWFTLTEEHLRQMKSIFRDAN